MRRGGLGNAARRARRGRSPRELRRPHALLDALGDPTRRAMVALIARGPVDRLGARRAARRDRDRGRPALARARAGRAGGLGKARPDALLPPAARRPARARALGAASAATSGKRGSTGWERCSTISAKTVRRRTAGAWRAGGRFGCMATQAKAAPVRIGCSGWIYRHWRGLFYPAGPADQAVVRVVRRASSTRSRSTTASTACPSPRPSKPGATRRRRGSATRSRPTAS